MIQEISKSEPKPETDKGKVAEPYKDNIVRRFKQETNMTHRERCERWNRLIGIRKNREISGGDINFLLDFFDEAHKIILECEQHNEALKKYDSYYSWDEKLEKWVSDFMHI
jgi:hypothetical protein